MEENTQSQENLENQIQKEVIDILNTDVLDPTLAINILINAIQSSFNHDCFNDTDRMLIRKSLQSLQDKIEKGEDILIKVKE